MDLKIISVGHCSMCLLYGNCKVRINSMQITLYQVILIIHLCETSVPCVVHCLYLSIIVSVCKFITHPVLWCPHNASFIKTSGQSLSHSLSHSLSLLLSQFNALYLIIVYEKNCSVWDLSWHQVLFNTYNQILEVYYAICFTVNIFLWLKMLFVVTF